MAKVGDKYIIEIDSVMNNGQNNLYRIKGFRSLVFDEEGLNRLTKFPRLEVGGIMPDFTLPNKDYLQGMIDGLKFSIRCNGISGDEVKDESLYRKG